MSHNKEYLYSPVTERNIYEDVHSLLTDAFADCGAVMDFNFSVHLDKKVTEVYNECITSDNKARLNRAIYAIIDSQKEMQELNSLVASADENGKNTDRKQKAESCKDLMKQLDYAMIGHKNRGFFSMILHPITYYREYKAIEAAKTALVDKFNLKQEFVDKYTQYLNDAIERDLSSGKSGREVSVEINIGDKIETKVKGLSTQFSDRKACLEQAEETISVDMKNIKGLVGEQAWEKLPKNQQEYLSEKWGQLTDRILNSDNKDLMIDGTVMDKLVQKYYGLSPEHQNEEEYVHKKLVILDGFLTNNGYGNIPDLKISEDEYIMTGKCGQTNEFDDEADYDDEEYYETNSADYENFNRTNTPVYEAVKFVHEQMSLNEPDHADIGKVLVNIENDTKLPDEYESDNIIDMDETERSKEKNMDLDSSFLP